MSAVLSIGTTHPWNVAGVGLDIRVGADLATSVFTVVCAVSAQGENGVQSLALVPRDTIEAQLNGLAWREISAVRIGALGSADIVRVVHAALASREIPIVVDPVMSASRGGTLAADDAIVALADTLLTLPAVIATPNVPEAQRLLGHEITVDTMAQAAQALQLRGPRAVLLKGGHLSGAPVDVLASADGTQTFESPRLAQEMRGTGCVLAMALASCLAAGTSLDQAVRFARDFVRTKIASAVEIGSISAYSSADD